MANKIGNRERCKVACGCCEYKEVTPSNCTGSDKIGHDGEWGLIGFSPCGKYVAHQSDTPCDVINTVKIKKSNPKEVHYCQCTTGSCFCGSFLSHLISEPCTAR
jgi:hypothetical protein